MEIYYNCALVLMMGWAVCHYFFMIHKNINEYSRYGGMLKVKEHTHSEYYINIKIELMKNERDSEINHLVDLNINQKSI